MSSGLVGLNQLRVNGEDINISEPDTPVKSIGNQGMRSKSHTNQAYTGCISSAELQAHLEKLRMQQQHQHLSPFQNSNK